MRHSLAWLTGATLGFSLAFATSAMATTEISVGIDQTETVRIGQSIKTLSIGNPAIADVNIQDGNILFVLGRSFGRTNVVALDNSGKTVLDMTVFVTQPEAGSVTVFRGSRQFSYNCAQSCERALMPGDDKDDYDKLSSQINAKVGMGTGSASE